MKILKYLSLGKLKEDLEENSFDINQHIYSVFSRTLINTAHSLNKIMCSKTNVKDRISRDVEIVLNQIPTDGVQSLNKLVERMKKLEGEYDAQKRCNHLFFNRTVFVALAHIVQLGSVAATGTLATMQVNNVGVLWIIFGVGVVSYVINTLAQYSERREDHLNSIDEVLKQLDYVLQQTKGYEAIFKTAYRYLSKESDAKKKTRRLCKNIDKVKTILLGTLRRVKRNRSLSLKVD